MASNYAGWRKDFALIALCFVFYLLGWAVSSDRMYVPLFLFVCAILGLGVSSFRAWLATESH